VEVTRPIAKQTGRGFAIPCWFGSSYMFCQTSQSSTGMGTYLSLTLV
jgi:hypothetical protein